MGNDDCYIVEWWLTGVENSHWQVFDGEQASAKADALYEHLKADRKAVEIWYSRQRGSQFNWQADPIHRDEEGNWVKDLT